MYKWVISQVCPSPIVEVVSVAAQNCLPGSTQNFHPGAARNNLPVEAQDTQDTQDIQDTLDTKNTQDTQDPQNTQNTQNTKNTQNIQDIQGDTAREGTFIFIAIITIWDGRALSEIGIF